MSTDDPPPAGAETQRPDQEPEIKSLSNRDRDRFLELLAHPPPPTDALRRAAQRHRELIVRSE